MKRVLVVLLSLFTLSLASDSLCKDGKFRCGDLCISHRKTCYCGEGQIYGNAGLPGDYCCVEDETSGCKRRKGNAECPGGQVTSLTEKCGGECFQEYKHSLNHTLWSTYGCGNGGCAKMEDMCKGYAACSDGSDVAECNEGLQCITTNGPYKRTKYQEHYQCLYEQTLNDREYDNIHRKDEEFLTVNISKINYEEFQQCTFPTKDNKTARDGGGTTGFGLTCSENDCISPNHWCLDRTKFSVTTLKCQENGIVATDDRSLCRNTTFWKSFNKTDSCDIYFKSTQIKNGEIFAGGSRCTGNLQHCYYPWYKWNYYTYLPRNYLPTCSDNSDKIFHIGTTCNITSYVKTYCDNICNASKQLKHCNWTICNDTSQWMEDNKNDSTLMDPHDCQSSCSEPGPGCEACTNSTYFKCKDNQTCLHPDLQCDGHQHCQDGSDEDFKFCYSTTEAYLKKNIVKEFATLKCRSVMYPQIYTVATVCDGIIECDQKADEPPGCTDSQAADIGLSCIVVLTIVLFLIQKWILKSGNYPKHEKEPQDLELDDTDFVNESSYLNLHKQEDFKLKLSIYLAKLKYSEDPQQVDLRVKQIVRFESLCHENEQESLLWLYNNLNPELFKMIMDIMDPGLLDRKAPKVKNFLYKVFENEYVIMVQNIFSLILNQIDIFKDCLLVVSLLVMIGGVKTLIHFPQQFTSAVVMSMSLTIIVPLFLSSLGLLIEDPAVILTPLNLENFRNLKFYVQLQIILLSFFNSALLVNAYNVNVLKRTQESGEKLVERLKEGRRIKKQYIKYLKSEIGLEIYYQVPIQIVLLLFAFTETKTTGGLDVFFQATSYFGIDAKVIFGLSSCWSIISSVLTHRRSIIDQKVYLPVVSQVYVCLWGFAGTAKRILAIVGFFIPSLGLFNLLHHWQAEQMPFQIRRQKAEDGLLTAQDKLELNGLTEDVYWNQLDRTDWTDPFNPVFPEYSSYTGLSLSGYFWSFLLLLVLQFFCVLFVKFILVKSMRKGKKLDILRHCFENMNIPTPWEDFDVQGGSIKDFKKRRRNVTKEMFWVMMVNLLFHIIMLVPLIYTGCNILGRHSLLSRTISTREEENMSYQNTIIILPIWIIFVIGFSILEIVFYFLYSLKYHPTRVILMEQERPQINYDNFISVSNLISMLVMDLYK